jgi:hypothetical protein
METEMKRILAALGVTGLALLGATAPAVATDNANTDHKITICHATGSDSNPYVAVTVDLHALETHMNHQHDGDIIPANDGKVLPGGRNMDKAGILKAGCKVPADHGNGNGNGDNDHNYKVTICHATGSESNPYVKITVALEALKGHYQHGDDIIPAGSKWKGMNWDEEGQDTYGNGCVPCTCQEEKPPVVTPEKPPVVTPEKPPVVTPETPPVVTPVVPPVVTPQVPTGAVAPPAPVVRANNAGFNVQTAVAPAGPVLAPWMAGVIVMLLAAGGVAARKVLLTGGVSRDR